MYNLNNNLFDGQGTFSVRVYVCIKTFNETLISLDTKNLFCRISFTGLIAIPHSYPTPT